MRVVLFGAGASSAAGYPTTARLMQEVETYALSQPWDIPGPRSAWEYWRELRDGQLKAMEFLLASPNPEVILSTLDLYSAGHAAVREAEERHVRGYGQRPFTPEQEEAAKRAAPKILAARAQAQIPARARACLVQCLHDYFQHKHQLDSEPESAERFRYLRDLMSTLEPGDIVITFNWDALVERVLARLGRWTPIDGYGLNFSRLRYRGAPIPGPERSAIKVLKLHGSLGWYQASHSWEGTGIRLDGHSFLKQLGIDCDNEPFTHGNPTPDTDYSIYLRPYRDRPLIVYPTFLKAIGGRQFAALWQQAAAALGRADQIDIYGYSLPSSDGAGRVLLNAIRPRLSARGPKVRVHDPSSEARLKWKYFLGKRAHYSAEPLK
ncbi:MAG TPA: hypothetical protein VHJ20_10225 [Polyangia bacterium]|nr:hypothetical protein [Polyangia bacterium]